MQGTTRNHAKDMKSPSLGSFLTQRSAKTNDENVPPSSKTSSGSCYAPQGKLQKPPNPALNHATTRSGNLMGK